MEAQKMDVLQQAHEVLSQKRTVVSAYRDYLIPELFERNIGEVKLSQLSDAISAAEALLGKSIKKNQKEIIRYINLSINYN